MRLSKGIDHQWVYRLLLREQSLLQRLTNVLGSIIFLERKIVDNDIGCSAVRRRVDFFVKVNLK